MCSVSAGSKKERQGCEVLTLMLQALQSIVSSEALPADKVLVRFLPEHKLQVLRKRSSRCNQVIVFSFRLCWRPQWKLCLREFSAPPPIKWAKWTFWMWVCLQFLTFRGLCIWEDVLLSLRLLPQGTPALFVVLLLFNSSKLPACVEDERYVRSPAY